MKSASWLTAKRIRIHGLLLAVCLWTVYAVDMSTPGLLDRNGLVKGTDFLHFYTLGHLALHDRGDLLYDMRAQAELTRQFVPDAPDSLYVRSLRAAGFFVLRALRPLALRLGACRVAGLELLIYAFCCYAVWKTCPGLQHVSLDGSHSGNCFSGIFSSAGLGTDFRSRAFVLHSGVSRAATRSSPARRISHRFAHLQTAVGTGRGGRLCVCARMEGGRWRRDGCIHPTCSRLDALRHRGHAYLLACADSCTRGLAAARTALVPDPFAALFLVSPAAVAARRVRFVRGECLAILVLAVRVWRSGSALTLALLGAVAGHGAGVTSLDRV